MKQSHAIDPKLKLRVGQIFWIDASPPLDDDVEKRRPWLVVLVFDQTKVMIMACSTKPRRAHYDKIELPTIETAPSTTTKLPRRCWALPAHFSVQPRSKLSEYCGYLQGRCLKEALLALEARKNAILKGHAKRSDAGDHSHK